MVHRSVIRISSAKIAIITQTTVKPRLFYDLATAEWPFPNTMAGIGASARLDSSRAVVVGVEAVHLVEVM